MIMHDGRRCRLLLLLLAALMASLLVNGLAGAQSAGPQVLSNEAIVDFPETVTFQLDLAEGTQVSEAVLTYQLGQDSCLSAGTQVPVEVSGSSLTWTWIMSRSGNPPPGAQLWWEWTIVDDAGNSFITPRQSLTFRDDRFAWRTVEAGGDSASAPIRVHWYEGDEVGPILLEAAVAGLNRLEDDTGIKLQGDVQFFIYGSSADMREALLYVQDWAGGVAFSDYNTILIGVPPHLADGWGSSTVRHELAHLVIGQFGRSCLGGSRPTWLNEGLAVYAEGEPDERTQRDLENGAEQNLFQPVRSLNGAFPARSEAANLAYSQSYSLVAYLLDVYGQEKMQALILSLADARGYDEALEAVYGFNADGLETAWRAATGAPPRAIPPTPTPISAASIPTFVPLNAAQSLPVPGQATVEGTPAAIETEPAAPTTAAVESPDAADRSSGLCGLALAPLLLVVTGAGFADSRRRILK